MPKEALRDALASLHTELGTADKLDAESRALLSKALREIADRLDRDEPQAEGEQQGVGRGAHGRSVPRSGGRAR